jgi:uncharacterized membrane protein
LCRSKTSPKSGGSETKPKLTTPLPTTVLPAGLAPDRVKTIGIAALYGFIAYATYERTNLLTLTQWQIGLSTLDMARGTSVTPSQQPAARR